MQFKRLIYEKEDGIAKIILNWPEKTNALDYRTIDEMDIAFAEADRDDAVRVIVHGAVGKNFSGGHDLGFAGLPAVRPEITRTGDSCSPDPVASNPSVEAFLELEDTLYYRFGLNIRDVRKPTIAQVQGLCAASGMISVLMCDLVVVADDAKFVNRVSRMGVAGHELGFDLWDMGPRKAKEFLWTGDPIGAEEALRLGMVNRVVPRDRLESETMKLAKKIALLTPITARLIKRSINLGLDIMGQRAAWESHFMVHQLSQATPRMFKTLTELAEAHRKGDLKEWIRERDRAFEEELRKIEE